MEWDEPSDDAEHLVKIYHEYSSMTEAQKKALKSFKDDELRRIVSRSQHILSGLAFVENNSANVTMRSADVSRWISQIRSHVPEFQRQSTNIVEIRYNELIFAMNASLQKADEELDFEVLGQFRDSLEAEIRGILTSCQHQLAQLQLEASGMVYQLCLAVQSAGRHEGFTESTLRARPTVYVTGQSTVNADEVLSGMENALQACQIAYHKTPEGQWQIQAPTGEESAGEQ
jgi:hypothetical protein